MGSSMHGSLYVAVSSLLTWCSLHQSLNQQWAISVWNRLSCSWSLSCFYCLACHGNLPGIKWTDFTYLTPTLGQALNKLRITYSLRKGYFHIILKGSQRKRIHLYFFTLNFDILYCDLCNHDLFDKL